MKIMCTEGHDDEIVVVIVTENMQFGLEVAALGTSAKLLYVRGSSWFNAKSVDHSRCAVLIFAQDTQTNSAWPSLHGSDDYWRWLRHS